MLSQNPQSFTKLKTRSFTLIELLVVISIIGLISSIVLVSMKGFGEDARLAKSKKFSSSIQHVLGAYAVGIWRFETVNGGITPDESGYSNNGTVNGATLIVDGGVYSGTNTLSFDDFTDYVRADSTWGTGEISTLTFEAWIIWEEVDGDWRNIIDSASTRMELGGGNHNYAGMCVDDESAEHGQQCVWSPSGSVPSGKWHHIVTTYNKDAGSDNLKVYIDGTIKGERTYSYKTNIDGYIDICREGIKGAIDEVRIYNTALSAAEIQKHYAEGAVRHNIVLR